MLIRLTNGNKGAHLERPHSTKLKPRLMSIRILGHVFFFFFLSSNVARVTTKINSLLTDVYCILFFYQLFLGHLYLFTIIFFSWKHIRCLLCIGIVRIIWEPQWSILCWEVKLTLEYLEIKVDNLRNKCYKIKIKLKENYGNWGGKWKNKVKKEFIKMTIISATSLLQFFSPKLLLRKEATL